MTDFIELVEEHTNNECTEIAAEVSLATIIISGVIYCLALLL